MARLTGRQQASRWTISGVFRIAMGSALLVLSVATVPAEEEAPAYPTQAWFGDLHVHTSWSFDAYISRVRTTPDDAYEFAKGGAIPIAGGLTSQLSRPLDFMAVTDHSEFLGMFRKMEDPEHPISKHPLAADITGDDPRKVRMAFFQLTAQAAAGNTGVLDAYLASPDEPATVWAEMVRIADKHYEPGKFTTFPAYEWSSLNKFINLHRNIIFKDSARVPDVPYSMLDSWKPEDLWGWMDAQREAGVSLLAIPHNSNMSKGRMFPTTTSDDAPIDRSYAETRRRNEPIVEVIQIKGQSMTHPVLAPEDEFADFETYNFTVGRRGTEDTEVPPGSYVQEGLKRGLETETTLGVNPFQFGLIGSSDSHNSNSPAEEDNYTGSSGMVDSTPETRLGGDLSAAKRGSGGLAGVWAQENTRESIYEAMERRETFATSGPRIRVRLFGGWDFSDAHENVDALVAEGYANGVPMGGELKGSAESEAPTFLVWAMKDPESANLERVQIIKGWVQDGKAQEKIFDVALSDRRVMNEDGTVPDNNAVVDLETGTPSSDVGDVELSAVWTDPEFDPAQSSYYFARVLENPTPRWSTWDAIRTGLPRPQVVPATIKERAWSSPIWYKPGAAE